MRFICPFLRPLRIIPRGSFRPMRDSVGIRQFNYMEDGSGRELSLHAKKPRLETRFRPMGAGFPVCKYSSDKLLSRVVGPTKCL